MTIVLSINAEINIPITVSERNGINRIDETVSLGVPLSQTNNITGISNFKVVDSQNNNIPAQFRVLSRYHGSSDDASKAIRVVLVDLKASVNATQSETYYLKNSGSGTANYQDLITENSTHFIITTGSLIGKIKKTVSICST